MESPIRRGEQEENNPPNAEINPSELEQAENNPPEGETNIDEPEQTGDYLPDFEMNADEGPVEQSGEENNPPEAEMNGDEDPSEQDQEETDPTETELNWEEPFDGGEGEVDDQPDAERFEDESPAFNPSPEEVTSSAEEEAYRITEVQEIEPALNPKKVALILSGGGARGAFQVGAEMYARQVKGYQWDIIAGVSVGALNGAMLAMHRYHRLVEIWDHISNDQVYTGGFTLPSIIKILLGAKSFYGNEPLQRLLKQEFEAGDIIDDLHVGAVSLISGEYVQFTKQSLELANAILASSAIPVIWSPVDISPEYPAMVDGGVRNISPIGDVLDLEPDEIVIINCGKEQPTVLPHAPENVLSIGMRTLDILMNEIFINDIKTFLRINDLVKEAQEQGAVLHHPRTGRPLKYYPYVLIEPDEDLGETLDFSQRAVQKSLRAGVRRARQVLGRP